MKIAIKKRKGALVKINAPSSERRAAIRANRVIAIQHRLIKRDVRKTTPCWSLSTTKNMSITGLLFLSDIPYRVGDTLEISVVISGVIDILNGLARVVRVIEDGDTSYDIAVRFLIDKPKRRPAKKHR